MVCFAYSSLEIPIWESFLIPLKFIINNLAMFFQQNEGLGELLGNFERQISRPHWGSIESHAFCQYYTWQSYNYTMLQVC